MRRASWLVVLPTVLVVAVASPARAEGEIALSRDGRTWADSLATPLVAEDVRWVPGDASVESFYVRNQGPSVARLVVEVRTRAGARLLADDAVRLAARVDRGAWTPLTNGTPSATLTRRSMARRAVAKVDVAIRFRWRAPAATMTEQLPLALVVRLSGEGDEAGPPTDDAAGGLPDAGSPVAAYWLWLAAACLGTGLALLFGRRREQEASDA